jgi:hypothetical protein
VIPATNSIQAEVLEGKIFFSGEELETVIFHGFRLGGMATEPAPKWDESDGHGGSFGRLREEVMGLVGEAEKGATVQPPLGSSKGSSFSSHCRRAEGKS